MNSATNILRQNAISIWKSGVKAVDSEKLVQSVIKVDAEKIHIGSSSFLLSETRKVVVVGGGKGGTGMALGVEKTLKNSPWAEKVSGWVNVPADCLQPTQSIHLHPARPAGHNEPTEAGVLGTNKILKMVTDLNEDDLCIALICGGGSALLPAPKEGFTLEQIQHVTKHLMKSGASIEELNTVRKQMSAIKGGGLVRASNAGHLKCLIISDVIGDPLDVIASGPTLPSSTTLEDAIRVLKKFAPKDNKELQAIVKQLETSEVSNEPMKENYENLLIGNNETSLDACRAKAEELGYEVKSTGSENRGIANELGRQFAQQAVEIQSQMNASSEPVCLLSGGEPIVEMTKTDQPQKGGRNQELALAAAQELWACESSGIVILSGGTDGEDGPTDAAGGICDSSMIRLAKEKSLSPKPFLEINNSYPFLEQTDGLLKTGPTHTNVMDVRVMLIHPADER